MVYALKLIKKPGQSRGAAGSPGPSGGKKADPENSPGCRLRVQDDAIDLTLPGITISLTRRLDIDVPHEVSIIIPRAELRFRDHETELVYSSITIVHSPRHPLAGEIPPGGESPGGPPPAAGKKSSAPRLKFGRE